MYANNIEQLQSFLIFTILGILIGIIFDIFRILRKTFKTADIITYIQDVIFWIITGGLILLSIFIFNNGELRFYLFIGIFIGLVVYMLSLSKYFIKINVFIINLIKKIISKILQIILKPVKILFIFIKKIIFKPISFIFINFKKSFTKIFKLSKNIKILNKKLDKNKGI